VYEAKFFLQEQQTEMLNRIEQQLPKSSTEDHTVYQYIATILGGGVECGVVDGYLIKLVRNARPWYHSLQYATFMMYETQCGNDPQKIPACNQKQVTHEYRIIISLKCISIFMCFSSMVFS